MNAACARTGDKRLLGLCTLHVLLGGGMGGEAKGRSWGPHREGLVTRERSPGIMQEEMGGGGCL